MQGMVLTLRCFVARVAVIWFGPLRGGNVWRKQSRVVQSSFANLASNVLWFSAEYGANRLKARAKI